MEFASGGRWLAHAWACGGELQRPRVGYGV